MMTMITINSINVKPFWFLSIFSLPCLGHVNNFTMWLLPQHILFPMVVGVQCCGSKRKGVRHFPHARHGNNLSHRRSIRSHPEFAAPATWHPSCKLPVGPIYETVGKYKTDLHFLGQPVLLSLSHSAASVVKSIYLGIATAARIPMMTIITINSINVNPLGFLIINSPPFLNWLKFLRYLSKP